MGTLNFNTICDAELGNLRKSLPADTNGRTWIVRFQEDIRTIVAQEETQSGVRTTLSFTPSSELIDALNEKMRQKALVLVSEKKAA